MRQVNCITVYNILLEFTILLLDLRETKPQERTILIFDKFILYLVFIAKECVELTNQICLNKCIDVYANEERSGNRTKGRFLGILLYLFIDCKVFLKLMTFHKSKEIFCKDEIYFYKSFSTKFY